MPALSGAPGSAGGAVAGAAVGAGATGVRSTGVADILEGVWWDYGGCGGEEIYREGRLEVTRR